MKKTKTAWLNFILHVSAKINKSKEAIIDGGILKTLGVALKIILLEILLLIVSLPIYIFISPLNFSNDKKEVQKYRLKRIVSLVSVCTFIVIFLITSILSGGIFLAGPTAELRADSLSWGFDSPKDYIYDFSKIQIVDGLALFKPAEIEVKGLTELPTESTAVSTTESSSVSGTESSAVSSTESTAVSTTESSSVSGTESTAASSTESTAATTTESTTIIEKTTCEATIQAINSLTVPNTASYDSFVEVSSKNNGEIYYQLSDDNGQTWYYWNSKWVSAGQNDYNTAKEVNDKIKDFPVNTGQILFKAFLIKDCKSEMQLLDISITFSQKIDKKEIVQDTKDQDNLAPTADTGGPYSVEVNSTVKLDGSASSDSDGTISSYDWNIIEGPGSLTGQNSPIVTYNAPEKLDSAIKVTVKLTVIDDDKESSTVTANITVLLVSDAAPTFMSAAITGTAKVGSVLTAAGESYIDVNGDMEGKPLYQWIVCNSASGAYTAISGATSSTYTPITADLGQFIKVIVTPTAQTGTSPGEPVTSFATAAVSGEEAAPEFLSGTITGTAKAGSVLTAAGESYIDVNGDPEGTPLYQWTICESSDGTYADISGATGNTYTPATTDLGKFIKVIITPTAQTGTSPGEPVTSFATAAVSIAEAAPTYSSAAITGTAKVGATLTAGGLGYFDTNGDPEGTPLYQWTICNSADGEYTYISGATGSAYTLLMGDLNKFIKVIVTPTALTGTSPGIPMSSTASAAVIALSLDELKNEGALSPNFNMWKDDSIGGSILGSGGLIYINNPNAEYSVKINASLQAGSNGGYGIFFDTTTNEPDGSKDNGYILQFDRGFGDGAVLIRPRINGVEKNPVKTITSSTDGVISKKSVDPLWWTAEHAIELNVSTVSTGANTSNKKIEVYIDGKFVLDYNYQIAIPTQDQKYYTGLRAWTAKSNFYSIVLAAETAPTFTSAAITGTAKVGVALTAAGIGYNDVNGDLAGTPRYQWMICDTADGTYTAIPSAISSTYAPSIADSDKFIKVEVTPTAITGASPGKPVTSVAILSVLTEEAAPAFSSAMVTGTAKIGAALTASGVGYNDVNGDLAGTPRYQWMICDTADGAYNDISGAVRSTYAPIARDIAKFIKVKITPTAQTGTSPGAPVTSSPSIEVLTSEEAPIFSSAAITGTAEAGLALTAAGIGYNDINGDLAGTPLYQWRICDTQEGTYTDIPGATNSTYELMTEDLGKFIKVIVTPIAQTGTSPGAPMTSSATTAVKAAETAPTFTDVTITGTAKVGLALTAEGIGYSDINGDLAATPLYQWTSCITAGGIYSNISGSTYSTYTPLTADLGKFIKVSVTPTAQTGTLKGTPIISVATLAVLAEETAPTFTSATITGTAKVGTALTASGKNYSDLNGDLAATPIYQWTICSTSDGTYTDIAGATNSTYKPVFADLAKFIKVKVTPTALTGESPGATLTSAATAAILATAAAAPSYTGAAITGIAKVGAALTASGIGYSDVNGDLEATPSYQWMICSTANGTYSDIFGATSNTYTPIIGNLAKFIKVKVTPKALTGTSQGTPVISAATAAVLAAPETAPTFTAAAITGTAKVGTALTASGSGYNDLNGDLAATPLYQWTICDTADGTYTDIAGATNSTYKPIFADLGKFIKVKITPTALTGTSPGATLTSAATAAILATAAAAPSYTGAAITGIAKVGAALTASGIGYSDVNGDLEATPSYQWMICSTADGTYTDIFGATSKTYMPIIGNLAKFIKVKVTPKALTGTSQGTPVISAATAAVLAAEETAPTFTGAAITGIAQIGTALKAAGLGYNDANGDLASTPLYQWTICSTADGIYTNISGASSSTYIPVIGDLSKFIKVNVTPTALTGTSTGAAVTSSATAAVLALPAAAPSFTGAAITGIAQIGTVLTAAGLGYNDANGDLASIPLYQWMICSSSGGTYADISGATNNAYTPVTSDLGKFIKVKITPTALTGTSPGTPVTSSATVAVFSAETAPSFTGAAIIGTAQVGSVLTAAGLGYSDINGDLQGTTMYQWIICSTSGGTYVDIPGAVKGTYTPVIGDMAKFIKVKVVPAALTGKSPGSTVRSAETAAVLAAPETAPAFTGATISGTSKVGAILTAAGIGYIDLNGDLAAAPLYQWIICSTADGTYADIPGETNSYYTSVFNDSGKFIKVKITPTAQTGTSPGIPMTSSATTAVAAAAESGPSFSSAVITGTAQAGSVLSASGLGYYDLNGDLQGTTMYQWTICSTADGIYIDIPGAIKGTYTPVIGDLTKFIKVKVVPAALTGKSPGSALISAATSAVMAAEAAPAFTGAEITGTAKVGSALKASGSGYSDLNGDLAAAPLYQWKICSSASGTYTDISGAENSTYTPSIADLGKFIKAIVTPTAQTGTSPGTPMTSPATAAVLAAEAAPTLTNAAITGLSKVGLEITAIGMGYADVNGDPAGTPLYQWTICDTASGTYTDINGATDSTYTPAAADLGKFIKVILTPTAQTGTSPGTPMTSSATAAVIAAEAAPAFTGAAITGTAKVGLSLTATGTGYSDVNGDLPATPLYQWKICDTMDGTFTDINGATASTYTPAAADLGKFIKVILTPTAQTGTSPGIPMTSSATAAVIAAEAAPAFTGAAITGTAKVGLSLTATGTGYSDVNGDLSATPLYQWTICSSAAGTFTDISGAKTSTYTPTAADLGRFIKVIVTPTAQTGTSPGIPMTSSATAAVIEYTPSLSLGSTFSEISGAMIKLISDYYTKYGKYPRSFSPYNYTDIGLVESEWNVAHNNIIYSPTGNRLNVRPADGYGFEAVNKVTSKTIRMPYTLKYNFVYYVEEGVWYYHKQDPNNVIDISTFKVYSVETGKIIIEQAAPAFTGAEITGTAKVDTVLTAAGIGYSDVNADPSATPLYQWKICNTEGGTYADISGATTGTYTPVAADLGKFIKVKITPTAQTGTSPGTSVTSDATAAVKAAEAAPAFAGAAITGTAKVGLELTAFGESYSDANADPSATPLYQWRICNTEGGTYADISGATTGTYTPVAADIGKFIKVIIIPTAQTGTSPGTPVTSVATSSVSAAEAAPTFSSAAITGTGKVDIALTASGMGYSDVNGDLSATPLYQWKISNTVDGTYTDISGAASSTYTPVTADIGKFIKVNITPTSQTGTSPGTPVESDAIGGYSGKPKITINSATQQTDYGYIYIDYTLVDAENHLVDLSNYEYSLTGDFTGEEASLTAAASDDKHAGLKELPSSAEGIEHTFVWDALSDLSGAHNLNLFIRLKPYDGIEQGDFSTSNAYIIGFKKPVISNISALQTAGTNKVVVSYDLYADNDKLLVTLEISEDGGTTWTALAAGLSGDIGTEITVGTGRTIIWDAAADFKGKDKTDIQIRLKAEGAWQNTSDYAYSPYFALDTKAPLGLNYFSGVSAGISSIVWSWTPVSMETNFKYYKIIYGQNLEDVRNATGTALVWDTSNDVDLSVMGTAGTIINGLSEGTTYYAGIWAVDNFGNEANVAESQFITKNILDDSETVSPFTPILNQPSVAATQSGTLVSGIAQSNSDNDLYIDGEIMISGFAETQSDGKFIGTIKLEEGKHEIYVLSVDSVGNSSKRSNIVNVNIDFGLENMSLSDSIPIVIGKAETDKAIIIEDVYRAAESLVLQRPQVIEVKGIDAANNIIFAGKGVANSEVVVFIHSEQFIAYRVKVNENGDWRFSHSQDNVELVKGDHEVYALTLDAKSQVKSRISDIKKFQVKVNPLAVFLSYFDLPTTLLTIFVLLMGITVFFIWRRKKAKINRRR